MFRSGTHFARNISCKTEHSATYISCEMRCGTKHSATVLWIRSRIAECSVPQFILIETQPAPKTQTAPNLSNTLQLRKHTTNGGCAWRWRCRSEMRRGSWRGFRVEGYFGLHNTILRVFWFKLKSLEVPERCLEVQEAVYSSFH